MSPEVMAQTSEVLKEHGFDTESRFLSVRQANTLIIHPPVSCCTVEPSCNGQLVCDICDLCYWIEVLTLRAHFYIQLVSVHFAEWYSNV